MKPPTVAESLAAGLAPRRVTDSFGQSLPSALFLATPAYRIRQVAHRTVEAAPSHVKRMFLHLAYFA